MNANVINNQIEITNTIKLLVFKKNPLLLEKVDFDNDNAFLEPLLFAYFNSNEENLFPSAMLEEIMQGYFIKREGIKINYSFNKNNIAYIPSIGYFKKGEPSPFETIQIIQNTTIEIFKGSVNLLQTIFRNSSSDLINQDEIISDIALFKKNIPFLTNAFRFIKENSFAQFQLIEQCCKKCLMFKTNPENINSFATINAHGIAFFNVYQEDYDEVFFVDDIAHQTGHIILTTLLYDRKAIFKIDEEQNVEEVLKAKDHRSIYTLLHALYTYYTTLMCLDDCLTNNSFKGKQRNEAIGRIGFYLDKCTLDMQSFEKINEHYDSVENVLTSNGLEIFTLIKKKYLDVFEKWYSTTKYFDYGNQPYNFNFKKFTELNK